VNVKNRVCFVIVTFNSERYLEQLCCSLKTFVDLSKDVIAFVDNGSSDGTLPYLQEFSKETGAMVFRNDVNRGFAQANNKAMRIVDADYYLLLNHDAYLTNDIASDLFSYFEDLGDIDIVGPSLVFPDGSYQTSAYPFASPMKWLLQDLGVKKIILPLHGKSWGRILLRPLLMVPMARPFISGLLQTPANGMKKTVESVNWISGACMLISQRTFKSTGGFDENIFMYGEDEELCLRAQKAGHKVQRVSAGPVVHVFGGYTNKMNPEIAPEIFRSRSYVISKNNHDRPLRRILLLMLLKRRGRKRQ
jgi:GT2 family glycosyltransferase